MVRIFEASAHLAAPPADVWGFHSDPANVAKVMPPGHNLVNIQTQGPAKEGDVFTFDFRILGFPVRWEGQWEMVREPELLVDGGIQTPFRHWRHIHRFEAIPGGTKMTDRVEFSTVGGFAGTILFRLLFGMMFCWRHHATRKLFGGCR